MNLQPDKSRQTDKAWERLYGRLERDGLLNEVKEKRYKTGFISGPALRFAASLMIITGATILLYIGVIDSGRQMVSFSNPDQGSTYVKTLNDGSVVYLAGNSTLSYPDNFRKNSREVALKGEAYFEVAKVENARFKISTQLAEIEVLGTSFIVKCHENESSSISVNTGRVRITHKTSGQTVIAEAGEIVNIEGSGLEKGYSSESDQFLQYSARMHFKDESLEHVAEILNRNISTLKFEILPGIEDRKITATFSKESPDSIAELISLALNLRYLKENDKITIYEVP